MKLDFNFDLLGLDDQPIEGANAGKLVAQALVTSTKGNALKMWEWALALNKGEVINLDSVDQETLKSFISDSETFTILAKAQLLKLLKKD
jgi:hypothetical protein